MDGIIKHQEDETKRYLKVLVPNQSLITHPPPWNALLLIDLLNLFVIYFIAIFAACFMFLLEVLRYFN